MSLIRRRKVDRDAKARTPHPPLRGTFSRGEKEKGIGLRLVRTAMGNRSDPSMTMPRGVVVTLRAALLSLAMR